MIQPEQLALRTHPGELYERMDDGRLRCLACGHSCPIKSGLAGVCKVRFHRGGRLGVAIPDTGQFQTPLGEVNVDLSAARDLRKL